MLRSSNVKNGEIVDADNVYVSDKVATSENVQEGDIIVVVRNGSRALIGKHAQIKASMPNTVIGAFMSGIRSEYSSFVNALLDTSAFENEVAKNSIDEECRRQHAADPPRPAEDQQHRRQCGPDEAGVSQMGEKEHPCIQNLGAQSLQNRQKHQFNVHKALSFSFRCVQDTRSL